MFREPCTARVDAFRAELFEAIDVPLQHCKVGTQAVDKRSPQKNVVMRKEHQRDGLDKLVTGVGLYFAAALQDLQVHEVLHPVTLEHFLGKLAERLEPRGNCERVGAKHRLQRPADFGKRQFAWTQAFRHGIHHELNEQEVQLGAVNNGFFSDDPSGAG